MTQPAPRRGGERGAALVEMAIVLPVLALLLFGIITFGATMSFKQSMSQATNEAARAAAVAPRDLAVTRATAAANRATSGFGVPCNEDAGLTCSFVIAPCSTGGGDCMTVELTYDLRGHPRVPSVPGVSSTLPDTLVSRAVVQVDP
ncbi:MAG: TadE family protein [Acidimicrobiales bacterium]|nr:TadE family protein [Acidimicrobiales bacterium]